MRGKKQVCGAGQLLAGAAALFVLAGVALPVRAEEAPGARTIVVFGDSQAAGLARGLQRVLVENRQFRVLNRTHAGAALVHSEREWLQPEKRFVASGEKADIAVAMYGANDRLDLRDDDGKYLHFRTPAWRRAYAARIDEILQILAKAGLKIVWCGNPIARSAVYSDDMRYINDIYAGEVRRFGGEFVPLWDIVANDGHYTAFGKDREGTTERLRADDGIHFTAAGYEIIAEKILGVMTEAAAAAPPAAPPAGAAIKATFGQGGPAPAAPIPPAAGRPPVVPAQNRP